MKMKQPKPSATMDDGQTRQSKAPPMNPLGALLKAAVGAPKKPPPKRAPPPRNAGLIPGGGGGLAIGERPPAQILAGMGRKPPPNLAIGQRPQLGARTRAAIRRR
jgi:hypothetical protein